MTERRVDNIFRYTGEKESIAEFMRMLNVNGITSTNGLRVMSEDGPAVIEIGMGVVCYDDNTVEIADAETMAEAFDDWP